MKKILSIVAILLFSITTTFAQIKNEKKITAKVYGNCGMCKKTIEKVGNKAKVCKVVWSEEAQIATITFDSKKTNKSEILKRIAAVGYDNEEFSASKNVYDKLPACCQYERKQTEKIGNSKVTIAEEKKEGVAPQKEEVQATQSIMGEAIASVETDAVANSNKIQSIYDSYFELKNAFVKTDADQAQKISKMFLEQISNISEADIQKENVDIFNKVKKSLIENAEAITAAKDINLKREKFSNLSNNMILLFQNIKSKEIAYIQHCPMANEGIGADWVSKSENIENPYYGAKMMTCGKVTQVIK